MVSVPGQLQTKFADMQQSQGFMMQQYLQVAQALGASEVALGNMRQLVLASQQQTTDLAKRVMETDGRLASGMEELTRLRNEQNYAARHSGAYWRPGQAPTFKATSDYHKSLRTWFNSPFAGRQLLPPLMSQALPRGC